MVITDIDHSPLNTSICIYTIAKLFDIPQEEVKSLIAESQSPAQQTEQPVSKPKPLTTNNLNKLDAQTNDKFFDALEFEPPSIGARRSEIPDEYANDPDLWYAIQASMNDGPSHQNQNRKDEFQSPRTELDLPDQEKVQTESTGENIASLNDAFETPKKKADQGIKTFDFLGQLSSTSNQQNPTMTKQDYMRLLREKR